MNFPDVISRTITRPQSITIRYLVVEDVQLVAKTCYVTPFSLRVTLVVVIMHKCVASGAGITILSAGLPSRASSIETPDVIAGAVAWTHGVARRNFVVKHVERVALGSYTTRFCLRVTTVIVVEHESLALGGRGTKPCAFLQSSTISIEGPYVVSRAVTASNLVSLRHNTTKLITF